MHAYVRFRTPQGELVELGHGDLIGRLVSARLAIDDPRVSEAHAIVSLRRGELVLLSLRRMFSVRGKPESEAVLAPGMEIELAPDLTLLVEDVRRPDAVLAVESPTLGRRALPSLASLSAGPPLTLGTRFEPEAQAHVWWNGDGWRARMGRGTTRSIAPGDTLRIGGEEVRFSMIALENSTTTRGGLDAPMRIVAWYDGVEIHRQGRPVVTLGGVGARIVSELVAVGGPAEWSVVAREVWKGDALDPDELRHRWDVSLARLRTRLREAGIRADLLRSDGSGYVQIVPTPEDVVEDKT
ncbi:MAG: hypothetical protein K1X94_29830 [Sandaracinaceae bacterium]|nr:hypothetical protein [Sandaracinaceae bacterium]